MHMHVLLRLYFRHSLRSLPPSLHDRRQLFSVHYNAKLFPIGQWLTDLQRLQVCFASTSPISSSWPDLVALALC